MPELPVEADVDHEQRWTPRVRARALPSDPCNTRHDNESNTTGKTGRGMNMAPR